MQSGVIFCGTDIETLGLEYVPENANTFVHQSSEVAAHEQAFEAHDGGYFYGTTTQTKNFTLRCIFQESNINHGVMDKIIRFFRPGRSGRLVFKQRPWVWYAATVVGSPVIQISNYQNGLVTIPLKAYYPYGRCDSLFLENETDDLMRNLTGLLPESMTPASSVVEEGGSMTTETTFLLYNGGTIPCPVAVEIAGTVGGGVTITNNTTKQSMRFVALSHAVTTDVNKYLVTDSLNGRTVLTNGWKTEPAFVYHDHGFIHLKPSYPVDRNITVSVTDKSNLVTSEDGMFTDDMIDKYIYIKNSWKKIMDVLDASSLIIDVAADTTATLTTTVAEMNEITVKADSSMDLSKLNFVYFPTFT